MCFEVKVISIILSFVFLTEQSTLEISYLFILLLTHVFWRDSFSRFLSTVSLCVAVGSSPDIVVYLCFSACLDP